MGEHIVEVPAPAPHVLMIPVPAQSHVNSMLNLAEILCVAGDINITFLVSKNIHDGLLLHANVESRFSNYRGFRLLCLPDGIYEGKIITTDDVAKLNDSFKSVAEPFLREVLLSLKSNWTKTKSPFTTIIADGVMSFAIDAAEEMSVPIFYFRPVSASAFWAYFSLPQLIENGEIPFSGDDDMDVAITNVKGMEGFLRRRDLPSFCRSGIRSPDFEMILTETAQTPRANGLILNTFEDLEGPILSQIRTFCPNLYTIGPLHAHLKSRMAAVNPNSSMNSSSNSLQEEDRSCIEWLDKQPSRSVLYVSFGSVTVLKKEQLLEFWKGLVNSGVKFLWVIRPDLVTGKNCDEHNKKSPADELETATKERGYMVGWAPQKEVLAHPAVGGFWTHSGWNSTLESVVEGVPMICWPYFGDQQINSRFVGEVWKIGLDMKDTCDKVIVEQMIKDLMVDRKDDFLKKAEEIAKLARKSIGSDDGSSFCNLDQPTRLLVACTSQQIRATFKKQQTKVLHHSSQKFRFQINRFGMGQTDQNPDPHILIFPFPLQGHVNSMLKLAEVLCLTGGINITYLVPPHIHRRLLLHANIESRFSKYPGFCLLSLPDGIYDGDMNTGDDAVKLFDSLNLIATPFLRDYLLTPKSNWANSNNPITTIISDGASSAFIDIAQQIGVPIIYFRTVSACAFWAYFSAPELIEAGEIPFSENELDLSITSLTGMEGYIRRRDLPGVFRDIESPIFKMLSTETRQTPRTNGLILNTFDDLEGPIISQIRTPCPNLYTIGPLHAHLKSRLAAANSKEIAKLARKSIEKDGSSFRNLERLIQDIRLMSRP
ncbi:OLC1v1026672C1 [Oldenlandia corymbosa var. corymbosa]|uniref:OLC1v1026672C1 n=1 Tax=Oldenlandia corymbosa var. corymbosa TaxID=529605 RepID=A0AAV1C7L8_OLDCO|nr:OLC1v1026672C1 [Oldenlandia corymbosa var. corymbosa]